MCSSDLVGLAVGDALGTTLEFKRPGSFEPITDMVGGGPFCLQPGEWTDDTSLAMCLAESLVRCRGFDPVDQLERYCRWHREGYWSSNGRCFDIGNTTYQALVNFERTHDPKSGPTDPMTAGNGSLMRLAPVPLACWRRPKEAIRKSGESSVTTHGAPDCIDACSYFGGLLVGAMQEKTKEELLSPLFDPTPKNWWTDKGLDNKEENPLTAKVHAVANGSFKRKEPPEIRGSGYVVASLEAALWAFYKTDNFRDGALMVVNLGDDADTTGAIYGQIAGTYYGFGGIPEEWRNKIARYDDILQLAEGLYHFSETLKLQSCAICDAELDESLNDYPGAVCRNCDRRSLNKEGNRARHIREIDPGPQSYFIDGGDNPVFIDGIRCRRRYRFGGWVTMRDDRGR